MHWLGIQLNAILHLQGEFQDATINGYWRTEEESAAPLQDPNSPVYKAGLRLVSIETKTVDCPLHSMWVAQRQTGNAQASLIFTGLRTCLCCFKN